ncbi:hypothetical protein AAFF_G00420550 [Aldrovandia affinis]|uniref:Uncharacterized protein n=1 Tax=Aldrovandia affinis TaxID=143900 RepID=A0AAD7SA35_9TELE|nr:hypothetical protein AAFF_G00420550 [Aldrovandia affinis]
MAKQQVLAGITQHQGRLVAFGLPEGWSGNLTEGLGTFDQECPAAPACQSFSPSVAGECGTTALIGDAPHSPRRLAAPHATPSPLRKPAMSSCSGVAEGHNNISDAMLDAK